MLIVVRSSVRYIFCGQAGLDSFGQLKVITCYLAFIVFDFLWRAGQDEC